MSMLYTILILGFIGVIMDIYGPTNSCPIQCHQTGCDCGPSELALQTQMDMQERIVDSDAACPWYTSHREDCSCQEWESKSGATFVAIDKGCPSHGCIKVQFDAQVTDNTSDVGVPNVQ